MCCSVCCILAGCDLMRSVMCEAGLSRPYPVFTLPAQGWAENPYGPFHGLGWSLIFIILWIRRSSSQHMCNFPVILPSCMELWVMCFKSLSGVKWLWAHSVVWTRPVCLSAGVSMEMWCENEKTSESWENMRRRSQASGWSRSSWKIWGAKSELSSLKGMLRVNTSKARSTALVA